MQRLARTPYPPPAPPTPQKVKYVVELARALARHPAVHRVDLLTRLIGDPKGRFRGELPLGRCFLWGAAVSRALLSWGAGLGVLYHWRAHGLVGAGTDPSRASLGKTSIENQSKPYDRSPNRRNRPRQSTPPTAGPRSDWGSPPRGAACWAARASCGWRAARRGSTCGGLSVGARRRLSVAPSLWVRCSTASGLWVEQHSLHTCPLHYLQ
jgi:hypothetical protein